MNVLVTGGAGFIGSHLVEALTGKGHQITVLDDFSSGDPENLVEGCRLVTGDIRDAEAVESCVHGQEVVFHLAAFTSVSESIERPEACLDINVRGMRNLLDRAAAAGVRRVVFASTSAVYPEDWDVPMPEETPPEPKSPYAESKLEGERLLEELRVDRGVSYAALRFFNVYGARQDELSDYASVIPVLISSCLRNEAMTIFGDGTQTRDFVQVADVADAGLRAMESEACGIFNVGTSVPVSVLELADTIKELTGSDSERIFGPPRAGDARSSTADISRIAAELGWSPQWDLSTGLKETIRWFAHREDSKHD